MVPPCTNRPQSMTVPDDAADAKNAANPGAWVQALTGRVMPIVSAWRKFWRRVSRLMPTGLYPRSLIIVIAPVILLHSPRWSRC